MKNLSCILLFLLINSSSLFSQVAINTDGSTANNSAMLDVKSNNKGFLPPRMTRVEMNAIPNPADGLIIYCNDCLPDGKGALSTFMDGNWNSLIYSCFVPIAPIIESNIPSVAGIVWDWKGVPYAIGYRWNLTNDFATATQMDTVTTKTETGMTCNTLYTRYVWAYNTCGNSLPLTLSQTTTACSIPTLTTRVASSIAATTAFSGGNITYDGGSVVTARGVCWGTAPNPTISNSKTSDGTGKGYFESSLTGLAVNMTYYVRAYAINSVGTGYGNEITFKTLATPGPIIFNPDLTYGTMSDNDGNIYKTITIGEQTWMAENLKTTKYRNGDVIPIVTVDTVWAALATGAYCWSNNDAATYKSVYGALYNWYAVEDSRNIAPIGWHVPTEAEWYILTDNLGGTSATGGYLKETGTSHWPIPNTSGSNNSGFTALPGGFRYDFGSRFTGMGNVGIWWSSTSSGITNARIRQLSTGVTVGIYIGEKKYGYSVRCVKDLPVAPILTTANASSITCTTATSGGNITSDGGSTIKARGVCWGTSPNPTISNSKTSDGTGIGYFESSLTGLAVNITYYIRAYAINNVGTGYGNEITFKTLATPGPIIFNPDLTYGTMTDNDGNVYKTITIGTQTWMAENLKTTKYRNSDPIPNVTYGTAWGALTTGAYCWYNNDAATYKVAYGAMYNWNAVSDIRNIAPTGWHVPTDNEFTTLTNYLGGESVAGGMLKEIGTAHWQSPNTDATNSSGFTALPSGYRYYNDGTFTNLGYYFGLWSSPSSSATHALDRGLYYLNANVSRNYSDMLGGFSVRCVKDAPVVPTLSTTEASSITTATATSGGNITSDGGSVVTARGVCWGTAPNPTTADSKTSDGTGIGVFSSSLTSLIENTNYYVRAYATNSTGTFYGNEILFNTFSEETLTYSEQAYPNTTGEIITINFNGQLVTCELIDGNYIYQGDIILDPNKAAAIEIKGKRWPDNKVYYTINSNFPKPERIISAIKEYENKTNLTFIQTASAPNSIEFIGVQEGLWSKGAGMQGGKQVIGIDGNGTSGNIMHEIGHAIGLLHEHCKKGRNNYVIIIENNIADKKGNQFDEYPNSINTAGFDWDSIMLYYSYAFSIDKKTKPTMTKIDGTTFGCNRTYLSPTDITLINKIYPKLPTLTTSTVSSITDISAICGGDITSDGGAEVTERGVCWGTSSTPTITNSKTTDGAGIGSFTSTITGLSSNTTYYVRAYATNSLGTGYGNEISFKTSNADNGTVTDIDGNVYHTVTIGTQVWMVENLKTTKYRNGETIPSVTLNASWAALATGAYCWYNNDSANKAVYGGLYNWFAVVDSRNIAPVGWHVPTDDDWLTLTYFIGVDGGKLKEAGTSHWVCPDPRAINSSGFTALPGGYRSYLDGAFGTMGSSGTWWSSSLYGTDPLIHMLLCNDAYILSGYSLSKLNGNSVRCVKD